MTHSLFTLSYSRCDPSGSAHFLYSHCRCEFSDNVDFLLQPHTLSSYCRCSSSDTVHFFLKLHNLLFTLHNFLLVLHTFSLHMAEVTFLILQTFSSQHAPCLSTTDVPFFLSLSFYYRCSLLMLYPFPDAAKTFSSYCRCNPPGTEHTLYWYYMCGIPHNEDFLFTPHTLSSCCSCNPPDTVHSFLTLHSLFLVLQMQPSWYCTLSLLVLQM